MCPRVVKAKEGTKQFVLAHLTLIIEWNIFNIFVFMFSIMSKKFMASYFYELFRLLYNIEHYLICLEFS